MATKKDLLVLLLDVGEHMQPYLPLLHRMVFNALNCKLLSKPNHEVAVVLYGTKDARHKLYDPADPLSYHHVSVLRPLQNVGSYLDLEPFAIASDPPRNGGDGAVSGLGLALDAQEQAEAEAALLARVESAGLPCRESAALCGRAARLFGLPGPKADWADGLVVALDLLASSLAERFDTDKKEAAKLGQLRVLLVSNLLGQSTPFDDEFRSNLADTCTNRRILLEVACLDHYTPPAPPPGNAGAGGGSGVDADADGLIPATRRSPTVPPGVDPLTLLPAELAAARRCNLEQLHLLKAEVAPAPFRHLRQPAELLCLFRAKEVAYQASNAVFMLTPKPSDEEDPAGLPEPIAINVKLYKKIRRTIVDEWKTVLDARPAGGVAGPAAAATGGDGGGNGEDGGGAGGGGDAPAADTGFVREVEYEDPTSGQKFTRDDYVVKGYSYGKQAVPIAQYNDEYANVVDTEMRRFKEKDFSLLGFIDAGSVARHRLIDEPQVVLGDSAASAVAIASLALVLKESNRAGVVRFLIRKEYPQLGLLTPHLSDTPDVPHALLLSPLPFAEDIRTYVFSTFRNEQEARDLPRQLAEARGEAPPAEPPPVVAAAMRVTQGASAGGGSGGGGGGTASQLEGAGGGLSQLNALLGKTAPEPGMRYEKLQPDEQQQAAALDLVRALDLGPSPLTGSGAGAGPRGEPYPEALPPEATANPVLQRAYMLVTSRALDPGAQIPDPEEDPLVELELLPHGRYWPAGAAGEAVRRAEEKLRTRERADGGAGPAAKRARGDEAGAAGGEEAAGTAAAAADPGAPTEAVVFDPSAAGGTAAARVTRVAELTAVEDFRAMLRQGRDSVSDAVQQLQELVRDLVGKSIGDQLYAKAIECVSALREGCAATGRAGAFNRYLQDLAEWCKSAERVAFVSELAGRGLTLITAEDLDRHRPPPPPAGSGSGSGSGSGAGSGDGVAAAAAGLLFQDDGGAASGLEARQFLQQYSGTAESEAEATLPAVVQDEEFEDMD